MFSMFTWQFCRSGWDQLRNVAAHKRTENVAPIHGKTITQAKPSARAFDSLAYGGRHISTRTMRKAGSTK